MAARLGYKRDAVRVKAMKVDGSCLPDTRKFSVDPEITTHEVLRSILTKAFELNQDFTIFYRVLDDYDQETYLPLLSDWDLDAAFMSAAEPCLCLRIEMKVFDDVGEEWDGDANSFSWITESKIPLRLQDVIMNHVEKTVNIVRGALNFMEDIQQAQEVNYYSSRVPLTDTEFRKYLDPVGQLTKPKEFRNAIFFGGIEPSLRKVVWRHLLGVYPAGLSGKQRIEYMKKKSFEYEQLKNAWRNIENDDLRNDLTYVTSMVKKDVLRTDRQHHFYAGNDDNQNIVSLFNILTTYALNHPSVSYCQGMSDLASPLLVTMDNEAHAYICFCSLMRRLSANFLIDGVMMTQRFQHLSEGLLYHDPVFFAYLKTHQADDLLFCYRWLLLEMKREFAFDDALRMLEVMWSSLPPTDPPDDLPLYEVQFCSESQFLSPTSQLPRETPYTKVCALRRQPLSRKKLILNYSLDESVIVRRRLHANFRENPKKCCSLDDNTFFRNHCNNSRIGYNDLNNLADVKDSSLSPTSSCGSDSSYEESYTECDKEYQLSDTSLPSRSDTKTSAPNKIVKNFSEFLRLERKATAKKNKKQQQQHENNCTSPENRVDDCTMNNEDHNSSPGRCSRSMKTNVELENLERRVLDVRLDKSNGSSVEEVFIWQNPLQEDASQVKVKVRPTASFFDGEETTDTCLNRDYPLKKSLELDSLSNFRHEIGLPSPRKFGGGNPFLMFLCITVLCQHRDTIMKTGLDYNEIAMHFDKMVRKHNVTRVLNQARIMYVAYLKLHKEYFLDT